MKRRGIPGQPRRSFLPSVGGVGCGTVARCTVFSTCTVFLTKTTHTAHERRACAELGERSKSNVASCSRRIRPQVRRLKGGVRPFFEKKKDTAEDTSSVQEKKKHTYARARSHQPSVPLLSLDFTSQREVPICATRHTEARNKQTPGRPHRRARTTTGVSKPAQPVCATTVVLNGL